MNAEASARNKANMNYTRGVKRPLSSTVQRKEPEGGGGVSFKPSEKRVVKFFEFISARALGYLTLGEKGT